jgi:hypothetical protein
MAKLVTKMKLLNIWMKLAVKMESKFSPLELEAAATWIYARKLLKLEKVKKASSEMVIPVNLKLKLSKLFRKHLNLLSRIAILSSVIRNMNLEKFSETNPLYAAN